MAVSRPGLYLVQLAIFVVATSFSSSAEERYIVRFKERADAAHHVRSLGTAGVAAAFGTKTHKVLPLDNSAVISASKDQISLISSREDVLSVEADVPVHAYLTPNDPRFPEQYGPGLIGAPVAWETTTGSSDVVIGVIDTGIDYTHPDLQPNLWTNPGEIDANGLDDDGDGYVDNVTGWNFVIGTNDAYDDNGHGTHVSGTIAAAGNNGVGICGVGWNTKILAMKALDKDGSGYFSDIAAAVDMAVAFRDRGINIPAVSLSLGGEYAAVIDRAVLRARTRGLLVIAASGNESNDNDAKPSYPASLPHENVISVAAVDSHGVLADFANVGRKSVDLGAPGVFILSTLPFAKAIDGYGVLSGTSMATPHVSGVVALLMAANPNLTTGQIRNILLTTTTPSTSLRSTTVAGGFVNADAAMQAALGAARNFRLAGGVSTKSRHAISGATVRVRRSDKRYSRTVKTDVEGGFLIDDVAAGTYTVTVTKKAYTCRKPSRINIATNVTLANRFTCQPIRRARK